MFRFTQLRPVNGINISKVRLKYIPIYDENIRDTKLLKGLKKNGLPKGLQDCQKHIESSSFNNRLKEYYELPNKSGSVSIFEVKKLALLVFGFKTQTEIQYSSLTADYAVQLKGLFLSYIEENEISVSLGELNKEEPKIDKKLMEANSDDLYALSLLSSFYPEYRRFVDALRRVILVIQNYGAERTFEAILEKNDAKPTKAQLHIFHLLFLSRLLLPNDIEVKESAFSEGSDEGSMIKLSGDKVRGITDFFRGK